MPLISEQELGQTNPSVNKKQLPGGWTKHAPAGGITINGKFFKGGTFIPNEDVEKMTPEEKQELEHKLQISNKYGSKQAKKILQQEGVSAEQKRQEKVNEQKEMGINENVYVIDDGTIQNERFGNLIIKKGNPIPEDLKILNALNSKRLDVINPSERTVSTYTSESGQWAGFQNPEIQKLDEYDLLNNLSPGIKAYFSFGTPSTQMSLNTADTDWIKLPEEKPILTRIKRLSLKNSVWLAEKDQKKKIFRLCGCNQGKNILFAAKIYHKMGAEVPEMEEEPDGISSSFINSNPCELEDTLLGKFVNHFLTDVLLGNKDVLGEANHHILEHNDLPIRTKMPESFSSLSEIPEEYDTFKEFEPYSSIYNQTTPESIVEQRDSLKKNITPEEIDNILQEINYPEEDRENLKEIILKRLYNILEMTKEAKINSAASKLIRLRPGN